MKYLVYLIILGLLFSTNLTSQMRGEEAQALAPLPSNQTPFPLVSFTLNSSYFLSFFGDVYAKLKSHKECKLMLNNMEQWSTINVNFDLFNKKIIYNSRYFNWANLRYCEFCSQNH